MKITFSTPNDFSGVFTKCTLQSDLKLFWIQSFIAGVDNPLPEKAISCGPNNTFIIYKKKTTTT